MNDLYLVTGLYLMDLKGATWHDLAIHLHRQTFALQTEGFHQLLGGTPIGDLIAYAIYGNLHRRIRLLP